MGGGGGGQDLTDRGGGCHRSFGAESKEGFKLVEDCACKLCGGSGIRIFEQRTGGGSTQHMQTVCSRCKGQGAPPPPLPEVSA